MCVLGEGDHVTKPFSHPTYVRTVMTDSLLIHNEGAVLYDWDFQNTIHVFTDESVTEGDILQIVSCHE